MSELKACPFCGGQAEVIECESLYQPGFDCWVQCQKCCASSTYSKVKSSVIEWWNRRESPTITREEFYKAAEENPK